MAKKNSARKAKSKFGSGWYYLLVVVLLFAFAFVVFQNQRYIWRAARYFSHRYIKTNVGHTHFPMGYQIHGVDLSRYQTDVNWEKLSAVNQEGDTILFRFAFIKATEGLLLEDNMFDEHWENAKQHHIIRGAYHYFLPDRNARVQAANFISSVNLRSGDLPPVVDVEEIRGQSKKELVAALKEFLQIIEAHYKVQPILYSNLNFIEDYLADDFRNYKFWIAHYYRSEIVADDKIRFVFWQHTDRADLLGVKGTVDANVFTGDEREFQNLLMP